MDEKKEMEYCETIAQLQEENRRLKSEIEVLKGKKAAADDEEAENLLSRIKAK